ncbi:MAG: sialidase family protein [Thermoleophilaceae bacterium]
MQGHRLRRGLIAAAAITALSGAAAAQAADTPVFGPAVKLKDANGSTEPRVTITPDDRRWVITNRGSRNTADATAIVYSAAYPGSDWTRTAGDPAGQSQASIDTDIVATQRFKDAPNGRLIAAELDYGGINFRVSYSDDGGKTWNISQGATLGDTDRQWLTVGPLDKETKKPRVYLLFHNLASGSGQHNMYVQTSNDGGESFGPPVGITQPGTQEWEDLQCADSGGPGNIFVNQRTGDVYAVWGTRTAPVGGGCGSSIFGPFEINVVAATRVWTARSTDGGSSFTSSLAVDDSAANDGKGKIVGMQLAVGALDSAGNVYVVYPESPGSYPNYDGAAVKYVWSGADLKGWAPPVTVAPPGGAGHVLTHIVAGDPGQLDFTYFTGEPRAGKKPAWYMTTAQAHDGQSQSPQISELRLSDIPTYTGTASELMGACDQDQNDPSQGVQNGTACTRSTDVWGIALDSQCRLVTTWPVAKAGTLNDASGDQAGTYVATQTGGPTVCQSLKGGAQSVLGAKTIKRGLNLRIGHLNRGANGRVRLRIRTRRGTGVVHSATVSLYRIGRARLSLAARARNVTLTRKTKPVALRIRHGRRLAPGRYYVRVAGRPDSQRETARTRARRRAS